MSEQLILEPSPGSDPTNPNPYDFLFDPNMPPGAGSIDIMREPSDRERVLFALPETEVPAAVSVENYDHLLTNEDPKYTSVEDAAVRTDGSNQVTEESENEAVKNVESAMYGSDDLYGLFSQYQQAHGLPNKKLPEALRSDAELRLRSGIYLSEKMKAISNVLPARVRRNAQKKPDVPGYERFDYLSSDEYVELLALAMLDGTFSQERASSNPIEYNPTTEQGGGQHRYAARQLLNLRS